MIEQELKRILRLASDNKDAIEKSEECGCFYCKRMFPASQITEYVKGRGSEPTTAICPFCNIDAVLPGRSSRTVTIPKGMDMQMVPGSSSVDMTFPLGMDMLAEMHERWFSPDRAVSASELRKMPRVGDLVITEDGFYAIVLAVTDTKVDLFLSNGLRMDALWKTVRCVPLKQNYVAGVASANFAELLRGI